MSATENQTQDNIPSEESVLPENNDNIIEFETPSTEMTSTQEVSEPLIPQEDAETHLSETCETAGTVSSTTVDSNVPVQDNAAIDGDLYQQPDSCEVPITKMDEELMEQEATSVGLKELVLPQQTEHQQLDSSEELVSKANDEPLEQVVTSKEIDESALPQQTQPAVHESMDVDVDVTPLQAVCDVATTDQFNDDATTEEMVQTNNEYPEVSKETVEFSPDDGFEGLPSQETVSQCIQSSYSTDAITTTDQVEYNDDNSQQSTEMEGAVISDMTTTPEAEAISSKFVSEQPAPEIDTQQGESVTAPYLVGEMVEDSDYSNEEAVAVAADNQSTTESSTGVEENLNGVSDESFTHNDISSEPMAEITEVKKTSGETLNLEQAVVNSSTEGLNQESDTSSATTAVSNDTSIESETNKTDSINVMPAGTTLVTNLFDYDFSPPRDSVMTQTQRPSQKQTNSLFSQASSSNSFQSAFAAFASGGATASNTQAEVEESPGPIATVSDTSAVQEEAKKISVLEMPGQESSHSKTPVLTEEVAPELGMDPTGGIGESTTSDQVIENQVMQPDYLTPNEQQPSDGVVNSDAVYFIQMADASGEVVTSIIDPNDIASYTDSVVYKQCMGADGQIETTIVSSGGVVYPEEQGQLQVEAAAEPQQEMEQQVIYAHDANGQLTPIDSAQSANDVAPPGKQFVYMQDSSGRIIRTIMDANQTMVPGQQVYYTQSEDGRIITSVMDSESAESPATATTEYQQPQLQDNPPTTTQSVQECQQQQQPQQEEMIDDAAAAAVPAVTQHGSASGFAIDNSMSGLSMLAELSHLTAGQAPVELKGPSSSNENSSSQDADMDEFRPVAMITRRVAEDGVEDVNSDLANLKVQGAQTSDAPSDSTLAKLTAEVTGGVNLPPPPSVSRDNLFVQWQNLDAMCWMDVVLIMLVYSPSLQPLVNLDPSHELASTLLITLLKANRQAQVLLQNLLKRSAAASSVQNGAGNVTTLKDSKTSKLVCKENMDEIGKAINILYAMREQIWQALQPRLQCERGKHNSPVLVLPLLVREKPIIKQMFTMKFRYVFKCDKCGYSQDDTHSKILPTIPAVPPNFNMNDPCFVRNCFDCQAPNQRMLMKFEGLHDFVQMHFVKGLPHSRFEELCFDHNGDHYEVTAVVHYKNNPDHFIAWVRNAPGNTWMECDDLKSVITRYQAGKPPIPPSQVHMVMWERRLMPQHIQMMKDTEDTKILSSLVLTVQQPGGSQTTQDAAGAAKPTMPSSLTGMTQGTASSVLSGLISQSQQSASNFSPYTPRGRGGRGRGRGSRGGRTSNVTIKRGVASVNNQMVTPGTTTASRPVGSPQIIRLPLSALQGMGSQLRGTSPGVVASSSSPSQRVILMGGNSNAQTSSSAVTGSQQKKVVVLRSQDGSTALNQLSTAQLLQLLQCTGAISNSNTRITTTISKASGDGTAQQQTITLTPTVTGQVSAAVAPVTSTLGSEVAEPVAQTQTVQSTLATSEPLEEALSATAPTQATAMEVDPMSEGARIPVTSAMEEAAELSQTAMAGTQSEESVSGNMAELSTVPSTSISLPSMASTSELSTLSKASTVTINSGALKALARTGLGEGGNRYVQIPNPKGGPNIMTQLIVRGDKMMLVPVDKSSQSQQTSSVSSSPSVARPSVTSSLLSAALQSSAIGTHACHISSLASASSTASLPTTTTSQTTRLITIPGGQGPGGKRTIQLISIPRGSTTTAASGASSGTTKTIILGQPGSQQQAVSSRIISQSPAGDASGGNIIVRELKRPEDTTGVVNASSTAPTVVTLSGESGTQTPIHGSSAISLLRDMTSKSIGSSATLEDRAQGISSSVQMLSKAQESFKYILPGSNNMTSIQTVSGAQLGNKAFTALSSSGTIIGGQLTPVNANTPDMTPSPVESVDTGVQSIFPELDAINPTVITSRGRGRGSRGGRGKVRGTKTPRGRGRVSQIMLEQQQVQNKVVGQGGTISMLPADFHQVGGQIIETSTESVDGAPMVSIPDFSNVAATTLQTETQVVSESGLITTTTIQHPFSPPVVENLTSPTAALTATTVSLDPQESTPESGPRVITQTIPSIKANHGFDILTQGILGNAGNPPPPSSSTTSLLSTPRKTGISLLTGKAVTSPPASNLFSSSPSSSSSLPFSKDVSRMQQTLAMGHSVSQNEIETLIKAAQGAAKPPKPGQSVGVSSLGTTEKQSTANETSLDTSASETKTVTRVETAFNVDDFLSEAKTELDKPQVEKMELEVPDGKCNVEGDVEDSMSMDIDSTERVGETDVSKEEKRVFSVDESQVSAAERYRMPTELFQPDDESPEKPVRRDSLSRQLSGGSNILGEDLPSKLFHDSEISSQEDELMKSPRIQQQQQQQPVKSLEKDLLHSPVMKSLISVEKDEISGVDLGVGMGNEMVDIGMNDEVAESEELIKVKKKKPAWKQKKGSKKASKRKSSSDKYSSSKFGSDVEDSTGMVNSSFSPNKNIVNSSPKKEEKSRKEEMSVGGFAIDILRECEDREKQAAQSNVCDEGEKIGNIIGDQAEVKDSVVCDMEEKENQDEFDLKKAYSNDVKDQEFIEERKHVQEKLSPVGKNSKIETVGVLLPTACVNNKKQKADWSKEVEKSSVVFNYRFLTRTRKTASRRHASLGPPMTSYTSAPIPLVGLREKEDLHEFLTCVVKRRHPKALERPKVDPSKEPTVIPLVPEEDADPACTCGGSVVTSLDKGEVFTGVVVRQRREIADWNSVVFDEEGDNPVDKWEDTELMREYLETMWTSMCMEIGFADFFENLYDADSDDSFGSEDECDGDDVVGDVDGGVNNDSYEEESAIGIDEEYKDDKIYGGTHSEETVSLISNREQKRKMDDQTVAAMEGESPSKRKRSSSDEAELPGTVSNDSATSLSCWDPVTIENSNTTAGPVPEESPLSTQALFTTATTTITTAVKDEVSVASLELASTTVASNLPSTTSTIKPQLTNKTVVTSTSRFNGFSNKESVVSTLPFIDSVTLPVSLPSTVSSESLSSSSVTKLLPSASAVPSSSSTSSSSSSKKRGTPSPAFISPTRRSSRTPVPSLKIRDSLEEVGGASGGAVSTKNLSKNRRASLVSSDEDLSGYSSDEVAIKKKVKKYPALL